MNRLRELYNDKQYMTVNFRQDMTFHEFVGAYNARGELLANLSAGKANAYHSKPKPSRAEVRARRGSKSIASLLLKI